MMIRETFDRLAAEDRFAPAGKYRVVGVRITNTGKRKEWVVGDFDDPREAISAAKHESNRSPSSLQTAATVYGDDGKRNDRFGDAALVEELEQAEGHA
jgi:hypothetical protein